MIRVSHALLALVLGMLLSGGLGAYVAYQHALIDAQGQQDHKTVAELSSALDAAQSLAADAAAASAEWRGLLNAQAAHDQKTTKELRHALSLSAAGRAGCRVDSHSMRLLDEAREAANAAAASGVLGTVPADPAPGRSKP